MNRAERRLAKRYGVSSDVMESLIAKWSQAPPDKPRAAQLATRIRQEAEYSRTVDEIRDVFRRTREEAKTPS